MVTLELKSSDPTDPGLTSRLIQMADQEVPAAGMATNLT
jgi:hypothetical protein